MKVQSLRAPSGLYVIDVSRSSLVPQSRMSQPSKCTERKAFQTGDIMGVRVSGARSPGCTLALPW